MDTLTIQILRDLNSLFYEKNAESFSDTRHNAWSGWKPIADEMLSMRGQGTKIDLLDIACGNLRFERYLSSIDENLYRNAYAVDACTALVGSAPRTSFQQYDVIGALTEKIHFKEVLEAPECAVTVAFGFLHHIPSFDLRKRFLEELTDMTLPGGLIALSFWQFMNDVAFAHKVRDAHTASQRILSLELEENDYILGWQGDFERMRYCHHFDDAEIDALISPLENCRVIDEYSSDGRNESMNRYVLLRKL